MYNNAEECTCDVTSCTKGPYLERTRGIQLEREGEMLHAHPGDRAEANRNNICIRLPPSRERDRERDGEERDSGIEGNK